MDYTNYFNRKCEVLTETDCTVPDFAEIHISVARAERIHELSKKLEELNVYKISDFDNTPEYVHFNDCDNATSDEFENDNSIRTDLSMIHITKTEFWYSAYIKHTSVVIRTAKIEICDLVKFIEEY